MTGTAKPRPVRRIYSVSKYCTRSIFSSSSTEATALILVGYTAKARSLLCLSRACADVSTLIYTGMENAGTLYHRYLGAITDVTEQAVAAVQKCGDILKQKK